MEHKFIAHDITPGRDKVESLVRVPTPVDVTQLRPLSGGLRYFRTFPPNMAAVTRPLDNLLKKSVAYIFHAGKR